MERRYKIYDSADGLLFVGVDSHYFKLSDAKSAYRESKHTEKPDDSILIEIGRDGAEEVEAILSFGVEEAERFALAMLNLCFSIKH